MADAPSPASIERDVVNIDIGVIDVGGLDVVLPADGSSSSLPLTPMPPTLPRRVSVATRLESRRRSAQISGANMTRRISQIARQAGGSLGRSAYALRRVSMASSTDLKIDSLTPQEVATTYVLFHTALVAGFVLSHTTAVFWVGYSTGASSALAWFVSSAHYAIYVLITGACAAFTRRVYRLPKRQPVQLTMAVIAAAYGVVTLGELLLEASLAVGQGDIARICYNSHYDEVSTLAHNLLNAVHATLFYVVLTQVCRCFRIDPATHQAAHDTVLDASALVFVAYITLRVVLGAANEVVLDYLPMTNAVTVLRLQYFAPEAARPPPGILVASIIVTACDAAFSVWAAFEIAAVRRSFRATFVKNLSKLLIAFNFFMFYNAKMIVALVLAGHVVAWQLPLVHDGAALRCTGSLGVTFGFKLTIAGWLFTAMYACLPMDAVGLRGWCYSSPNAVAGRPPRLRYFCQAADALQTGNFRIKDLLQSTLTIEPRHFVLEAQLEMFNFAYLAYACGHKDYSQDFLHLHRMIGSAEFALEDHIHDPRSDTHCLVAQSSDKIYVAFRGSMSWKNYKTDLQTRKQPVAYDLPLPAAAGFTAHNISRPNFCKRKAPWVHGGFWDAYQSVAARVLERLAALNRETPRAMFFTGHSLGGALATLCSLDAATVYGGNRVACTTFGCPRVGGNAYKRVYNAAVPAHCRFVNAQDPVCHTPIRTLWDSFTEVGTTVLLDALGNLVVDPNLLEYDLLNRGISGDAHRLTSYQMALFLWCRRAHGGRFEPKFWSHSLQKLREHHGHHPDVLQYLHQRALFVRTALGDDDDLVRRIVREIIRSTTPHRKGLHLFRRPVLCYGVNDAIDAMVAAQLVPSEADAVEMGRVMLVKGSIRMVEDPQVFRHDAFFTLPMRSDKVVPAGDDSDE
ncbi:Lipase domain protein [Achlya hypogyna]|uniref:Lipase domain protein n=1 Tax=Achlya hypogyna TaxID=1202772 RepID=A0A1V9YWL8_ACHHY|nr:Lipase domain protein [Achlya hypogyna]